MTSRSSPQLSFTRRYLLDANIFIAAWRDHYPIDLYPGFWDCIERSSREDILSSIDRVRDEITDPADLDAWLKRHWRDSFFSTRILEITRAFADMQKWVQYNTQFLPAAKHEFAQAADGWLAAFAKVHNAIVVTNEVFDPRVKRRVPLPNLCKRFGIDYCNTIDMLRGLGVTFDLRQPK